MIIAYTVILGGWDYLRRPAVIDEDARYYCFTDTPIPPCPPWEFQPAYTPFASHSRNSRLPKILSHLHFDAEYSIYHDANFVLTKKPSSLVRNYLRDHDIAMFRHPCRGDVEREANCILDQPREEFPNVDPQKLRDQVTRWKHQGAPDGLWAGGLILRRHTDQVADFNFLWWREFMAGCTRDQIALPMAVDRAGIEINTIVGDVYNNPLMAFHYHSAWRDKGDNPRMAELYRPYLDRKMRLEEICR